MKIYYFPILTALLVIVSGCLSEPPTLEPAINLSSEEDIKSTVQDDSDLFWLKKDTYFDPEQLIGTVFGFGFKTGAEYYGNPLEDFSPEKIGRIIGWENTDPAPPRVRQSLMLNEEAVIGFDALSYLSSSLQAEKVASIVVTDVKIIRALDNRTNYEDRLLEWLDTHIQLISNYHAVAVVDGAVLKSITGKFYTKYETQGIAGAFGVNISGSYYVNNEEYFVDYIFGLDLLNLSHLVAAFPRAGTMSITAAPPLEEIRFKKADLEAIDKGKIENLMFH
jgi:hypothetical protein